MLADSRERVGGGRGAALGLKSPRGQSQEETDADKSPIEMQSAGGVGNGYNQLRPRLVPKAGLRGC